MRASTRRKRERQSIQSELGRVDRMGNKVLEQARLHRRTDPEDFKAHADAYSEHLRVLTAARASAQIRLRDLNAPPPVESVVEPVVESPANVDAYLEGSEAIT